MATKRPPTINHHVPDEIIFSILSTLPVKSLLRFTLVSKSWNSMIRSSVFKAEHHHHINITHSNNTKYSHLLCVPTDLQEVCCTLLREIHAPPTLRVEQSNLPFPFSGFHQLIGVCEGLICLRTATQIYIWNPLVGKFKAVRPGKWPALPSVAHRETDIVLGFGRSRRSGDHNVVKLILKANYLHQVEIYSMAADSWRIIENLKNFKPVQWSFYSPKVGVFFRGSLYWVVRSSKPKAGTSILRFDLDGDGILEETAPPPWDYYGQRWSDCGRRDLAVVDGRLVLLGIKNDMVTVWVNKDSQQGLLNWTMDCHNVFAPLERFIRALMVAWGGCEIKAPDLRVFVHDYCSTNGFRLRDLGICPVESGMSHVIIPVSETLFLLDQ